MPNIEAHIIYYGPENGDHPKEEDDDSGNDVGETGGDWVINTHSLDADAPLRYLGADALHILEAKDEDKPKGGDKSGNQKNGHEDRPVQDIGTEVVPPKNQPPGKQN